MKCLVIKQPWASLVVSGRKSIELRSWSTKYRGPILVLAAKGVWGGTEYEIGPRGVTLGIVDLIDVRASSALDEHAACLHPPQPGYSWHLANPRPVRQVPVVGRLGLYSVPPELARELSL